MKKSIASISILMLTIASVVWVMTPRVHADTIIFTAQLSASNEVSAVNASETGGNGFVTVTLDNVANTMRFDVSINGLNNSSPIILSHIHRGPAGVNGPVVVDSGITPATPVAVSNGAVAFTRSNLTLTAALAAEITGNPGGFYFNSHSLLSPGGVVRGQLVRAASGPVTGAPTLSEWGAILMGLLIVAACVFFLFGRRKESMELAAAAPSVTFGGSGNTIDWRVLAKVTLFVEAAISVGLIALSAGATDVVGALTSGVLVAFIAHVFIVAARRR
jgi:hypothetical protein